MFPDSCFPALKKYMFLLVLPMSCDPFLPNDMCHISSSYILTPVKNKCLTGADGDSLTNKLILLSSETTFVNTDSNLEG